MPWNSSDPANPRHWLRKLAHGLGWLLAALGASGFAGWKFGLAWVVRPAHAFPPFSPVESLAILVIGLALAEAAAGRGRVALWGGAGLGVLGFATLTLHLGDAGARLWPNLGVTPGLGPSLLPVSSALLVGLSGIGLVGLGLPPHTDRGRLTAGATGATAAMLCLGILVVRLVWQADIEGGLVVDSSLQLLLTGLGLGAALAATTWVKNPETVAASWLPLSVGLASLVTVVLLWRAFISYEREQIRQQTLGAAQAAVQQVGRQVESATRALSRVVRFGPTPSPGSRESENTAVALTRDIDGLLGLAWVDSSTRVRHVLPAALDSDTLRADLAFQLAEDERSGSGGGFQLPRHFPLSGQVSFAIAVPVCSAGTCGGYIAGVFRAEDMLTPVLGDSSGGFLFAVTAERRTVLAPPGRLATPIDWTHHSSFSAGRVHWDISTWPSAQTLARHRSGLPDLLLLLGLLVSTLLPLAIRLGQLNLTRARLAERVRLKLALETATDGIWEWEVATGAARRSAALWRHLGYDPEAMGGRPDPWPWLIHAADQALVMKALSEHLAGRTSSFEARYRIRGQGGDWHWMVDRGRVVEWSPTGQPQRVMGISADVTERLRADEALAASERRFRACFESAHHMQVLLDRRGEVLEANRAAIEFAGLVLSSLRGRRLWDLSCWRGKNGQVRRIEDGVIGALMGDAVRRELELEDSKGAPLLLELSLSPILDGDGKVSQVLVDGRDITRRRRTEHALREVESLTTMGRIAARVAHEINNPLAGIQNAFLLIKDAVRTDHPHFTYVGAVEREIARIAAVTRQLYETYRPEQDGLLNTSLSSLVGDAVALLQQINRASGVRIEVNLSSAPGTIPLPEAILRQALYNLVQNAIEASPAGGVVEVTAAVEGETFTLAVGDRGAGIPDEIRERVFEPFFTTKDATVRTGGMGLGLSLVARSVQALDGNVDINDRAGGGTLVVVRLPLPVPSGVSA